MFFDFDLLSRIIPKKPIYSAPTGSKIFKMFSESFSPVRVKLVVVLTLKLRKQKAASLTFWHKNSSQSHEVLSSQFSLYWFNSLSPPPQSRCVPCGVWLLQRSSPGSLPFSGSHWATTSPAATPTPCPCATATPCQQEAAGGTTPPSESACPWSETRLTLPSETSRLSAPYTSGWRWATLKARKRAERSPSRPKKTVSGQFYLHHSSVSQLVHVRNNKRLHSKKSAHIYTTTIFPDIRVRFSKSDSLLPMCCWMWGFRLWEVCPRGGSGCRGPPRI